MSNTTTTKAREPNITAHEMQERARAIWVQWGNRLRSFESCLQQARAEAQAEGRAK